MPGGEVGCCLAPWGPCWSGQQGTIPSTGLVNSIRQHPWGSTGSREELRGCCASGWGWPRAVDTGGDTIGSWRHGQTHLPGQGEPSGECFGIPGRTCQPRQLKSKVPGQINPFPVIRSSLHTYLMLGMAFAVPQTPHLLLRRDEGERMGMLSAVLGGRWGLHPPEARCSVLCPARMA